MEMDESQLDAWLRRLDTPAEPEDVTNVSLEDLLILIEENEFR